MRKTYDGFRRSKSPVPTRQARRRRRLPAVLESLEERCLLTITPVHVPTWVEQGPASIEGGQVEGLANTAVAGAVAAVAVGGGTRMYLASVNGGMWRSDDYTLGQPTWAPKSVGLPRLALSALTVVPGATADVVYAGTGSVSSGGYGRSGIGIYRSTNSGEDWDLLGFSTFNNLTINNILPTSFGSGATQTLLVSATGGDNGSDGGVFRSDDAGANWVKLSGATGTDALAAGDVTELVAGANFVGADGATRATFYAGIAGVFDSDGDGKPETILDTLRLNKGVYRGELNLATGALSWARLPIDPFLIDPISQIRTINLRLAVHQSTGNEVLYAGYVASDADLAENQLAGLVYSTDRGATWAAMPLPGTMELIPGAAVPTFVGIHPGGQGETHFSIIADPVSPTVVYVGGDRQAGDGDGEPILFDPTTMPPSPNASSLGAQTYSGRLFRGDRSAAAATAWQPITHTGAGGTAPHADSRNMIIVGADLYEVDDGGVFQLKDHASASRRWNSLNTNLRTSEIYKIAYDPINRVIFAGLQDTGSAQQRLQDDNGDGSISEAERFHWETIREGDGSIQLSVPTASNTTLRYSVVLSQYSLKMQEYDASNIQVATTVFDPTGYSAGDVAPDDRSDHALVANAVEPGRFAFGLGSMYESSAPNDVAMNFVEIEAKPDAATSPERAKRVTAVAYGGMQAGLTDPDVLYFSRGNNIAVRKGGSGFGAGPDVDFTIVGAGTIGDIVLDPGDWARGFATDGSSIYQTNDAGDTWRLLGTLELAGYITNLEAIRTGTDLVLLAAGVGGVFRLINPPQDLTGVAERLWTRFGQGMPNVFITDLIYSRGNDLVADADDVLIASTFGRGVFSITNPLADLTAPATLRLTGDATGPNLYTIRLRDKNPDILEVSADSASFSAFTVASIDRIEVVGSGVSDRLTIDVQFGVPVLKNGIDFAAAGGSDQLTLSPNTLIGYVPADTVFAAGAGSVSLVRGGFPAIGSALTYASVETPQNLMRSADIFDELAVGTGSLTGLGLVDSIAVSMGTKAIPVARDLAGRLDGLVSNASKHLLSFPTTFGLGAPREHESERERENQAGRGGDEPFVAGTPLLRRLFEEGLGAFSLATFAGSTTATIRQKFDDLDDLPGNVVLVEENGVTRYDVRVVKVLHGQSSLDDALLGGLVRINGVLDFSARVSLHVVLGVDASGFFVETDASAEPELVVDQLSASAEGMGVIGFLGVELTHGTLTTAPGVGFAVNIHDPGTQALDGKIRMAEFPQAALPDGFLTVDVIGGGVGDGVADVTLEAEFRVAAFDFELLDDLELRFTWDTIDLLAIPQGVSNLSVTPVIPEAQRLLDFLSANSGQITTALNSLNSTLDEALGLDLLGARIPVLNKTLGELVNGQARPVPVPTATAIQSISQVFVDGTSKRFIVALKNAGEGAAGESNSLVKLGVATGRTVRYKTVAGTDASGVIASTVAGAFTVSFDASLDQDPAADPQLQIVPDGGALTGPLRSVLGGVSFNIPTLQDLVAQLSAVTGIDLFNAVDLVNGPGGLEIRITLPFDPKPLVFDTEFGVGDSIPGLTFDASGQFTVTVDPSFQVTLGIRLGADLGLLDRVYILEDDAPEVNLAIDVSLDDLSLTGSVGFLDVRLTETGNPSTNPGIVIHADLSLNLVDPVPDSDGGGRILLSDLPGHLLDVFDPEVSGAFTFGGMTLAADAGTINIGSLSLSLDGGPTVPLDSPDDLTALAAKLRVTGELGDFTNFRNITPQQILDMLEALIAQLTELGAGGIFEKPIPLVNKSFSDLVNIGESLASRLGNPSGEDSRFFATAKALEDYLDSKIDSDPATDFVDILVSRDDIRFVFTYMTPSFTRTAPLSFELGGGRAFAPEVAGAGELVLNVSATVTLGLGVRTAAGIPLAERIFLVADNAAVPSDQKTSFRVEGHANAGLGAGQAFSFSATLGPVQLGVVNGRAKLDASVTAGISDAGQPNPDGLLSLAEIAQAIAANQGGGLFTGGVSAEVQAILPIDGFDAGSDAPQLATGALGTDAHVEVVGKLTNVANASVTFLQDGPAVFTTAQPLPSGSLPPTIQVTTHNLNGLISGAFLDLGALIDGLEQLIDWGKNLLGIDKLNFKLPVVGKSLGKAFDFFGGDNANGASIRRFIDDLIAKSPGGFGTNFSSAALDNAVNAIRNGLRQIPGVQPIADLDGDGLEQPATNGDDLLRVTRTNGVVTGLEVLVKFSPSVNVPLSGGFDLGASFLNVSGDVDLTLAGSLQILLGLGLDKQHGFYVKTDFTDLNLPATQKEIMFHGEVHVGGAIDAKLGFLKLGGTFDPAKNFLKADFNIDLNGGATPNATAENKLLTFAELLDFGALPQRFTADLPIMSKIDVDLSASLSSALPSVGAKLNVDWNFNALTGNIPAPTVALSQLRLDLGSFLDRVMKPILMRMQSLNIVPQQLLDILNQPLPILNKTLFDVLILPLNPNQQKVAKFLFNIADVIAQTSQNAGTASGLMLQFDTSVPVVADRNNQLGSSNMAMAMVDPAAENGEVNGQAVQNPNPAAPGTDLPLIGPFIESLAEIGVTFPALKLSNLVKLFIGGDLDIVLINPPNLKIDVEFNQSIPLFSAGIPYVADVYISAFFGGGIHFQANISAGFDTSGLKRGSFLGGIYLGDFDPVDGVIDPTDPERPELTLTADIHAGIDAGVRLVGLPIGRATGTASLTASINVDLNDDNATSDGRLPDSRPYADHYDGKLHLYEIPTIVSSNMGNPFCLFDLSGSLDAELSLRLFVLLLFDKTISQSFNLLSFNLECEPETSRERPIEDTDDFDAPFQSVDLANLSPDRSRLTFTFASTDAIDAAAGTNAAAGDRVDVVLEDLDGDPTNGVDVVVIPASNVTVAEQSDGTFIVGDSAGAQFSTNGVLPGMSVLYTNTSGAPEKGTITAVANDALTIRPIPADGKGPRIGSAVTVESGYETLRVLKGAWFERFGPLEIVNGDPSSSPNYVADIRSIVSIDGSRGFLAGDDRVRIDPLIRAAVILSGGTGNDTLIGGSGRNTLTGGEGDDLLQIAYAPTNLTPTERQARNSALNGQAGDDTLIGGVGDDTLIGGLGDDQLDGFGGIFAGFDGETAVKTPYGAGGRDLLIGNGGDDLLNGRDDNDTLVGDNPNFTGNEGRDLLAGGDGDDSIWGDNQAASGLIDGPAPAPSRPTGDTITGGFGNDVIFAGAGNDLVDADTDPSGGDVGTDGTDTVLGGLGNDSILGRGGNDLLIGEAGDDALDGGDGDDFLFGGDGVVGPATPSAAAGTLGRETIRGGTGNDLIDAADSNSIVARGDTGNDTILGSRGGDDLDGGPGRDFLIGGPGSDRLDGGPGDDDLVGGRGAAGGVSYPSNGAGRDGADLFAASLGADVIVPAAGSINPSTRVPTIFSSTADSRSLDLSAYPSGVTIDLDSTSVQSFTGGPSLRLAAAVENFLGTSFADAVSARPLALPRLLQGGGGAGDSLTINALGATILLTPSSVIFTATPAGVGPFAPISFSGFATVRINNAAAAASFAADVRANAASLTLVGSDLRYAIEDGPVVTVPGITSSNFRALAGDDAVRLNVATGTYTVDGGAGIDALAFLGPLAGATLTTVDVLTLSTDLAAGASAVSSRVLGQINVGAAPRAFDVADGTAAADLVVSAVLSGSAALTKRGAGALQLTGNSPSLSSSWVVTAGTLRVDGSLPSSTVTVSTGTLTGVGTIGSVNVSEGTLDPGNVGAPGELTIIGALRLTPRGILNAQILGLVLGTSFDRVLVSNLVDLGGARLDATLGFSAAVGAAFKIIDNLGRSAVVNTFAGLPEGAVFLVSNQSVQISYRGGDGNDVVLTRTNTAPKFPNRAITEAVDEGGVAVLTGQISESDPLDPFELSVDWGDGSLEVFTFPPDAPRDVRLEHRYLDDSAVTDGRAKVHLVWSDPNGGSNSGDLSVEVANRVPELGAPAPQDRLEEGRAVSFRIPTLDPGADATTLRVDWGDGAPAELVTVPAGAGLAGLSHRFETGGLFRVRITADDGDGGTDERVDWLTVSYTSVRRARVGEVFQRHLGRNPNNAELTFWTARLSRGVPLAAFSRTIASSREAHAHVIATLYQTYLRRAPTQAELERSLRRGVGPDVLTVSLTSSNEYYRNHGGTPSGFISGLYEDLLGRSPDQSENARHVRSLSLGVSRATVARRIARER